MSVKILLHATHLIPVPFIFVNVDADNVDTMPSGPVDEHPEIFFLGVSLDRHHHLADR